MGPRSSKVKALVVLPSDCGGVKAHHPCCATTRDPDGVLPFSGCQGCSGSDIVINMSIAPELVGHSTTQLRQHQVFVFAVGWICVLPLGNNPSCRISVSQGIGEKRLRFRVSRSQCSREQRRPNTSPHHLTCAALFLKVLAASHALMQFSLCLPRTQVATRNADLSFTHCQLPSSIVFDNANTSF